VSLRIDWNNSEISIDRFWPSAKLLGGRFEARRTIFTRHDHQPFLAIELMTIQKFSASHVPSDSAKL
jgi:hypothetical protein